MQVYPQSFQQLLHLYAPVEQHIDKILSTNANQLMAKAAGEILGLNKQSRCKKQTKKMAIKPIGFLCFGLMSWKKQNRTTSSHTVTFEGSQLAPK